MTGWLIMTVSLALLGFSYVMAIDVPLRLRSRRDRKLALERSRAEREEKEWRAKEADVLGWQARSFEELKALALEPEPAKGTNVTPDPASLSHRPDLMLTYMDQMTEEEMTKVKEAFTENVLRYKGTRGLMQLRLAETSRQYRSRHLGPALPTSDRRTTARSYRASDKHMEPDEGMWHYGWASQPRPEPCPNWCDGDHGPNAIHGPSY